MAVPKDLKPGFYFLMASHDPAFGANNNHVTVTDFWVSDLALVLRSHWGEGRIDGFVLNAISGEPVAGAKVQTWLRQNYNTLAAGPTVETDKNGLFAVDSGGNRNVLFLASHKGQQLAAGNDYYAYQQNRTNRPATHTVFFTDRSLYRPGQTVQYKGICVRADQDKDDYQVLGNQALTVVFADPNGKEIARQAHRANDYGSFNGSFTAPRDRLMGQMNLHVEGEPQGYARFNVEEYKRPKFQVTLDAPKEGAKLRRRGRPSREGHLLHRGGDWRGEGALPCGTSDSLPRLVALVLLVADAAERQPGDCPRHGRHVQRRHVQDYLHRKAGSVGAAEGRADVPLRDQRRRHRHHR